jgi:hypothetical protein
MKDELGIENQLRAQSEQVQIISGKLVALTKFADGKNFAMLINECDKGNY